MTEPELEIELDAPALPVVTHRTRRVWIVGEDPAAAEARVRTQVAAEIAEALDAAANRCGQTYNAATIARQHATGTPKEPQP